MPKTITQYNLLISCPGDIKEEIGVIEEVVEEFNRNFGIGNNINIVCNHWSKDSFPQPGSSPQDILNKQFVKDCDLAVAVFWTRFGTQTDKYGSGSEEEIEEMISDGKQVFTYFLKKAIQPDNFDQEQYEKVKDFKEEFKNRGLYCEVEDEEAFKKEFKNHLNLFFLKIVVGKDQMNFVSNNFDSRKPELILKDATNLSSNEISVKKFGLKKLLNEIEKEIIEEINIIKNMVLTPLKLEDEESVKNETLFYHNFKKAEFSKIQKEIIAKFAKDCAIEIKNSFWELGNLESKNNTVELASVFGETSLFGSESEKDKYGKIIEIIRRIKSYNEYLDYILQLESLSVLSLVLSNEGNTFDEDIAVNLYFEKNKLIVDEDFPTPGKSVISELIESKLVKNLLTVGTNENIEKYEKKYQNENYFKPVTLPGYHFTKSFEDEKEDFIDMVEDKYKYFNYNLENENEDVLWLKFDEIKHNTNIAFPAILVFKEEPNIIRYSIRSKHLPDVTEREVILKYED